MIDGATQRSISKTVFIDAPPAMVWEALTDATELSRWFSAEARVEPRLGGAVWLSWGGGAEGRATITAWEPPYRFQWTDTPSADKQTVDFHLEWRTGCTVVRVIHSGFSADPTWDVEYGLANGGWSYFVQHLKWYIERHRGKARELATWQRASPLPRREAFARLIGRGGLSVGDAFARVDAGDQYKTTTAAGDELSGVVLSIDRRTCQMSVTIAELADALLLIEVEPNPAGSIASFWLSTYGLTSDLPGAVRQRYRELYDNALGPVGA